MKNLNLTWTYTKLTSLVLVNYFMFGNHVVKLNSDFVKCICKKTKRKIK